MDLLIGTIALFAYQPGFNMKGWLPCDGRELPIMQYQALFALIGTRFGGDGMKTFALPKLGPVKSTYDEGVYYYIAIEGTFPERT